MRRITARASWHIETIFIAMCLSLISFSCSSAETARKIAETSFPSVVMLLMEDANSQPTTLGSGFFVRENIIATNLHVVRGSYQGYAKKVGEKPKYNIIGVVGIDREMDLVLLEIENIDGPSLAFGNGQQLAVGDEVYVIGNPQGLEGTLSQGIISGIRDFGTKYVLQITAPISPGSSGGPVLNDKGRVIGVAFAALAEGQNLNFAIPAFYLSQLLTRLTPPISLASLLESPQEEGLSKSLGEQTKDAVVGENFSWNYLFQGTALAAGYYSFSLRNKIRNAVKDVYCYIIFYDEHGRALDVDVVRYSGPIPAGLAKRVSSKVHPSIRRITTGDSNYVPKTKVEFRILDFKIAG